MKQWHVGRNRHLNEWTSGGTAADYPEEHWEHFVVMAGRHDNAIKVAQRVRRNQLARERRAAKKAGAS